MAQGSSSSESSLWVGKKEGTQEREEETAGDEEKTEIRYYDLLIFPFLLQHSSFWSRKIRGVMELML